jgi:hypothetical protein
MAASTCLILLDLQDYKSFLDMKLQGLLFSYNIHKPFRKEQNLFHRQEKDVAFTGSTGGIKGTNSTMVK